MTIPIYNSLNYDKSFFLKTNNLDLKKLNNLSFEKVDCQKFPLIKILSKLSKNDSLFETVIVATNDEFVSLYLNKKIKFKELSNNIYKFVNLKEFNKYKLIKPKKIEDIEKLNKYVRLKINQFCI
jgi:1-deoxy-D-xylulose-5-phosphate reductoisomerase